MPFHFVEHGCPKDYLRFTSQFFEDVCDDVGFSEVFVDSKSTSGIYYTTHQLLKAGVVNEQSPLAPQLAQIHEFVMAALAMLQGTDKFFHAGGQSLWHTTFALAIKPGEYTARNETFDRSMPFYERFGQHLICPRTGLPVRRVEGQLASLDGSQSYDVINDVPQMFVLHGFNSGIRNMRSAADCLSDFTRHGN